MSNPKCLMSKVQSLKSFPVAPELSALPERPLVSIVIPSYNQGRFIRETIESCLQQDYRPIEILVVDGASTDETVDVLKSFGDIPELQWVSEPDDGVQDAVNKGVNRAKGDICAIQSSDDYYLPGAFAEAVKLFKDNPDKGLIYADTIKVDAEGQELSRFVTGPYSFTKFLSKRTVVLQPAAFFRREAFLAVGGWSKEFFNADTECWLRMLSQYPAALKVDAFWACRRMHPEQRDGQKDKILRDYERMTEENEVLRAGPRRWRRAAQCGRIRHTLRYGVEFSLPERKRMLWKAVRYWPPVLFDPGVAGMLVPYYYAVRRRLQKLKRKILYYAL